MNELPKQFKVLRGDYAGQIGVLERPHWFRNEGWRYQLEMPDKNLVWFPAVDVEEVKEATDGNTF